MITDGTSGGILPGILVQIIDGANGGTSTKTDATGAYSLLVSPGTFTMLLTATSYQDQSRQVTVAADSRVDFVLQRSPDPVSTTMLTYSRPADRFNVSESGTYTRANASFEATIANGTNGPRIFARVVPTGGLSCFLFLSPARGQPLVAGSYPQATRYPFQAPSEPGIDFACTTGCNTLDGSFVIREISVAPGGRVERLDVTFEQTCHRFGLQGDERAATLTGQLRIAP